MRGRSRLPSARPSQSTKRRNALPVQRDGWGRSLTNKPNIIPEGYESEDDFIREARERFTAAESYDRENRDAAVDDLKFLAGDQWDQTTYANRIAQGRPCLTI